MTKPKVSVIVPNYNHSKYLKERIDSILNQSYQDFELIILDDCSTDDSVSVINQYRSNAHVSHVLINDKNSGSPFIQWEKGINLSLGDYIWIAESDDVAHQDFLKILMSKMEIFPNAVVAFSHSFFIDSEGNVLDMDYHTNTAADYILRHDGLLFTRKILTKQCYIYNVSMTVFRKDAYIHVDKAFQKLRFCGDWLFWAEMCMQGDVVEVCRPLSFFRQHSNKVTARAGQTGDDWRDVSKVLHRFIAPPRPLLKGVRRHIFRGRWTQHFKKSHCKEKELLTKLFPDVYCGTVWEVFLYQLCEIPNKFHVGDGGTVPWLRKGWRIWLRKWNGLLSMK